MAKWCFGGFVFVQVLMLLWRLFGGVWHSSTSVKNVCFPSFGGFCGVGYSCLFGFGRFRCFGVFVFVFLVLFVLVLFLFCLLCFCFVVGLFLVLVLVLFLFLFFWVFFFCFLFLFFFVFVEGLRVR